MNMSLLEKAEKYATGKVNEAITNAIAQAYVEGYKAGYNDREMEIPVDLRDNKTEYVDLGLPSGTLWATKYESIDNNDTQVSDLDFRQFVHMPVVLPASCCFR